MSRGFSKLSYALTELFKQIIFSTHVATISEM